MKEKGVEIQVEVFEHDQFGKVRTVEIDGEPWLVGKDVATALGYNDTKHAILDHVDNEDRVNSKTQGQNVPEFGQRGTWLINESGLYSLVLSSKLPSAKKFRRWVTAEVLPSIRKHGAYMTPEALEAAILNPDTLIRLCQELKAEQEKRKALEAANAKLSSENQAMLPKAQFFDDLVDRNQLTNFRETAKELQVPERQFIKFLLTKKFVYRDQKGQLQPYSSYVPELFKVKECYASFSCWSGTQTLITPKGRATFNELCKGSLYFC